MKFHIATASGKWIGGIQCHRSDLDGQVQQMQDIAAMWKEPLVLTRLDGPRKGDTIRVEPR